MLALPLLVCGLASSSPPALPSGRGVVKLAAAAVSRAFADGIHRQTVRIPLSEAIYGDREEGFVADRAIGWQGGPEETYRYLKPLARELLQQVETLPQSETGGLPPRIKEQVLLDFDGSALLTAESAGGALGDVQAMLQPNTDGYYLKTIAGVEEQFSVRQKRVETSIRAASLPLTRLGPVVRDRTFPANHGVSSCCSTRRGATAAPGASSAARRRRRARQGAAGTRTTRSPHWYWW